jgi:dolichol kinase
MSDPIYIQLCSLWIVCIVLVVIAMNFTVESNGDDVKFLGISIPKIIIRKGFHIVTFMFIPGTILSYRFMYLAYGAACCIFIFIECIRIEFKDTTFGGKLEKTFRRFTDERDGGTLILTHSYLLFGCAIPLWMDNNPSFTSLLGIIVLGIGDTMASVFGVSFGKTKWPSSKKSVEGTLGLFFLFLNCFLGAIASMLTLGFLLSNVVQVETFPFIFSTILVALLEAFTEQIDNLCLPLFYVATYQAFLQ